METLAFGVILQMVEGGEIGLVSSAVAEASNSRYFLTCDDGVVGRYVGELKVLNPVEYVVSVVGEQL